MADKATIVEVAERAGTSLSTVSRVLSNSSYPVSAETKKRVLEASEALGYIPNNAARSLRSKRGMYIAVIVPSLNNPFYSSIISAIEREVLSSGYMMQLYSSDNDAELENRLLDLIGSVQAAAILISSINWDEKLEKKVRELGIPAVFFDQIPNGITGHFIGFDFRKAGMMAAEFLISEGHRDIVFGCGPFDRESRKLYRDGFSEVLSSSSIDCSGAVISGVMKRLEAEGLNVPADISVIGFDDIPYGFMISPSLTTIRQPAAETGSMAAKLAIDLVNNPEGEYSNEVFQPVLIKRESVRRLR